MSINLYTISDRLYAMSDLYTDHLFSKIPKSKLHYYIDYPIKIGNTVAETTKYLNKNFKLREICMERNINIDIIDKEYRVGKIKFRAEIFLRKRKINIMGASIKQLQECLDDKFTFDEVVDIHIAHELYHFIEYDKKVKTNQILDKIESFKFGCFKRHSTIVKTSEIAAHAYCKKLLGLNFHPKALDYQYMMKQNIINEKKLEEYFKNLESFL